MVLRKECVYFPAAFKWLDRPFQSDRTEFSTRMVRVHIKVWAWHGVIYRGVGSWKLQMNSQWLGTNWRATGGMPASITEP